MTEIRLHSNGLVHTPGFIPFIADKWKTQPSLALDMLAAYEELPSWAVPQILSGSYRIDGDVVVIEKDRNAKTPLTDLERPRTGARRRTR